MPVKARSRRYIGGKWFRLRHVDSSNVSWVAWPESGEPLMTVCYRDGALYGYLGVSRQRTVAAAYASSSGQYINRRIKPNFKVVKIADG